VLAACASEQPLWTSCPRAGWLAGHEARYMEHEMPYGELALVCPDGQILHHLDWRTDQPVALLKNVQRLTAPNPGVMTGPGTNSYLVGDPPPATSPSTRARPMPTTCNGCGARRAATSASSSAPIRTPTIRPARGRCRRCARGSRPFGPALGAHGARGQPVHARSLAIKSGAPHAVWKRAKSAHFDGHPYPGHAANHLCLVLLEDGLLFSGDHILNGSTTVVDPPDGDMTDYLESLDKLAAACDAHGIEFILPAHGHVLGAARRPLGSSRRTA
jgi:recombination protein RecT